MAVINFLKSPLGIIVLSLIFILISLVRFSIPKAADSLNWLKIVEILLLSVVGFIFLPIFLIKFLLKTKLSDYGFRLPENIRRALFLSTLTILLVTPFIIFFAAQSDFQNYYSLGKISWGQFLLVGGLTSLIYYFSEEFLFRGFLFFGLWPTIRYHSFWITSLIFTIFHVTKPPAEILFSFFLSLIFCYLSLKTKSFLPAAIIHFILALALNVLVTFVYIAPINGGLNF